MKRILLLVFIAVLSLVAVNVIVYGASKSFSGRVIYLEDGKFMVKTGSTESEFVYDSSLEIVSGGSVESKIIEICQYVRVAYILDGKTLKATRVEILKESDCYK